MVQKQKMKYVFGKPVLLWIVIVLNFIYILYSVFKVLDTLDNPYQPPIIISLAPFAASVPSFIGLLLNKKWAKFFLFALVLNMYINWAYNTIGIFSSRLIIETIGLKGLFINTIITIGEVILAIVCYIIAFYYVSVSEKALRKAS